MALPKKKLELSSNLKKKTKNPNICTSFKYSNKEMVMEITLL
jgi:hypothetical protein